MELFFVTSLLKNWKTQPENSSKSRHIKHQRLARKYKRRERLGRAIASVCPKMVASSVFITEFTIQPRGATAVKAFAIILVLVVIGITVFILEELRNEKLNKL